VQVAALPIAKHPRQLEYPGFAGREQLLAGEFRRGSQVTGGAAAVRTGDFGPGGVQMGLIARRDLQDSGFDLDKALCREPGPDVGRNRAPRQQERTSVEMPAGRPERGNGLVPNHQTAAPEISKTLAFSGKISMLRPETGAEVRFEAPSPPSI